MLDMLCCLALLSLVLAVPQECMFGGEECGGHGRCHVSTDGTPSYCVCDSDYTLSPTMGCVVTACYSEVLDVMCNNGECQQVDGVYKCVCPSDLIYVGGQCTTMDCISKEDDGRFTVCSNNGYCGYGFFGDSKCMCLPEYDDDGLCKTCNATNADLIDGKCISKKCLTGPPGEATQLCGGCGACVRTGAGYNLAYTCACSGTDGCKEVSAGVCGIDACISDNQLGVVCNDAGVCDKNGCHCNAGYSGPTCLVNENDPNACQSQYTRINGECVPKICVPAIPGDNVCGGPEAGTCFFNEDIKNFFCYCSDGYINALDNRIDFNYQCVPFDCLDGLGVCYEGKCLPGQGPYPCICDPGFHNDPRSGFCGSDICLTGGPDNPDEACSGHGQCMYYGCRCDPGYGGDICNEDAPVYCYEGQIAVGKECVFTDCVSYTPEMGVCGGFGTCVQFTGFYGSSDFYECQCDPGTIYDRDYLCLPSVCLTSDGQVCPHGSCQKVDGEATCVCNNGYKSINNACFPLSCLVTIDGEELVCANNGECDLDSGICNCNELFHGEHCDVPKDHEIVCNSDETLIGERCVSDYCIFDGVECNNHGRCDKTVSDGPRCACDLLYILSAQYGCVPLNCYDQDTDSVCPDGRCVGEGKDIHCECNPDFTLVNSVCVHSNCLADDTICSGNGYCAQSVSGEYKCQCDYLHSGSLCNGCSSDAVLIDGLCASDSCITVDASGKKTVCSGMGVCKKDSSISSAYCSCRAPFALISGKCVSADCYAGEPIGAPCNGRGYCGLSAFCTDPSTCNTGQCFCNEEYEGSLCESCSFNYIDVPTYGCVARTCYKDGLVCSSAGDCIDGQCQCASGYTASGAECLMPSATKNGVLIGTSVGGVVLLIAIIVGVFFCVKKARKGKAPEGRAGKKTRALLSDGDDEDEDLLVPSESESGSASAATGTDEIP